MQHASGLGLGVTGDTTIPGVVRLCYCPNEKSRTYLPVLTSVFQEFTLFFLPEQYKLLSDHIEQMATE